MHEHFTSGAINKNTSEYVFPSIATKENQYCCPHCNNDVVLRKGNVRVHHFAHKKEISSCSYYTKPTRNHFIMDIKMAVSTLYNNTKQIPIWIVNECTKLGCRTETMTVISQRNSACPVLRFDKSSNYIVFENTIIRSRQEIIKEVEKNYENSVETIEKNLILKEIEEISSIPTRFSTISNPFEIRSIFDLERNVNEIPSIKRDLRIADSEIDELNSLLQDSSSQWRVYVSKSKSTGRKYYFNKVTNLTTWCIPSDVIREEEVLITKRNINKIKSLEKELSLVESSRINKMNEEINSKIEEQEQKRIVLIELLPNEEYPCYSSIDSITIPKLHVHANHKHYIVNANNLMDQIKVYMEKTTMKSASIVKDDGSSPTQSTVTPFKLKCNSYNNYVCNLCTHKENENRLREENIRKLFYEKYPMYKNNNSEISYRVTDSPPSVKEEEAKNRKKVLIRRVREKNEYCKFREQYLKNEREKEKV